MIGLCAGLGSRSLRTVMNSDMWKSGLWHMSGISLVGCQELGFSSPVFSSNLTPNLEVNRRRVRNDSLVSLSECEAPIVGFADALHFRTNGCQSSCWYHFINVVLLGSSVTLKTHAHTCYSCGILWKVTIELLDFTANHQDTENCQAVSLREPANSLHLSDLKAANVEPFVFSLHPAPWLFPSKPALPLIVFLRWTPIHMLLLTLF